LENELLVTEPPPATTAPPPLPFVVELPVSVLFESEKEPTPNESVKMPAPLAAEVLFEIVVPLTLSVPAPFPIPPPTGDPAPDVALPVIDAVRNVGDVAKTAGDNPAATNSVCFMSTGNGDSGNTEVEIADQVRVNAHNTIVWRSLMNDCRSCARANDRSVVTSDVQVANVLVETETNFRAAVCC
jgi:hypothetical protein